MSKFNVLANKLAKKPNVTNPRGLAAFIGRNSLGQKEMTRRSIAGKKKK